MTNSAQMSAALKQVKRDLTDGLSEAEDEATKAKIREEIQKVNRKLDRVIHAGLNEAAALERDTEDDMM
jgi:hypothetical protein